MGHSQRPNVFHCGQNQKEAISAVILFFCLVFFHLAVIKLQLGMAELWNSGIEISGTLLASQGHPWIPLNGSRMATERPPEQKESIRVNLSDSTACGTVWKRRRNGSVSEHAPQRHAGSIFCAQSALTEDRYIEQTAPNRKSNTQTVQ